MSRNGGAPNTRRYSRLQRRGRGIQALHEHQPPRCVQPQPFINWSAAHYGSLYVDVPHHFCTRGQAEQYRVALAGQGKTITAGDFHERYRVAARLIGFCYIWWTLAAWPGQGQDTAWVLHYVNLILGRV